MAKSSANKKKTKKQLQLKRTSLELKIHWSIILMQRKKKGTSRSKKKSTISKKNYNDMQHNWGKDKEADVGMKLDLHPNSTKK
jgi:hypothetical protein